MLEGARDKRGLKRDKVDKSKGTGCWLKTGYSWGIYGVASPNELDMASLWKDGGLWQSLQRQADHSKVDSQRHKMNADMLNYNKNNNSNNDNGNNMMIMMMMIIKIMIITTTMMIMIVITMMIMIIIMIIMVMIMLIIITMKTTKMMMMMMMIMIMIMIIMIITMIVMGIYKTQC